MQPNEAEGRYAVVRHHDGAGAWYEVIDTRPGPTQGRVSAHRSRDAAHRAAAHLNIGDDHSASRRVDVLEREAPHLLARPELLEADERDAC